MFFPPRKLNIPTGLMRWKVEMKGLTCFSIFLALLAFNPKAYGEDGIIKKWTEQRERRQSLTRANKVLILENDLTKGRCIQGRRLNEMYAISFWSFKAHDSRLEENWKIAKTIIDKLDDITKRKVLNDKDELIMVQEAYEAGLLLAMRETCPDVW